MIKENYIQIFKNDVKLLEFPFKAEETKLSIMTKDILIELIQSLNNQIIEKNLFYVYNKKIEYNKLSEEEKKKIRKQLIFRNIEPELTKDFDFNYIEYLKDVDNKILFWENDFEYDENDEGNLLEKTSTIQEYIIFQLIYLLKTTYWNLDSLLFEIKNKGGQ